MILPDDNVLIYAFRADSNDRAKYQAWLEDVINGPATYAISPRILASEVRICAHPRIFAQPGGIDEVLAYCCVLLGQPSATIIVPRDRHWPLFGELCLEATASGKLVQDAWNAALAIEAACEWITTDRDYERFTGLKWRGQS